MERSTFIQDFSQRLIKALQDKGYSSSRSKSGIEMSELAKIAGVSYSMARKYVLGVALPDYHLIPKIAHWLNVSPGWLLFGEELSFSHLKSSTAIEIETELLRYILNKDN
jgi:transcriptional regulator with XRE-family HTH domain